MHTLDIVFSVFALIFVTIGIKRGFIGEVIPTRCYDGGFLVPSCTTMTFLS